MNRLTLHEASHALVAWLLGWRIDAVEHDATTATPLLGQPPEHHVAFAMAGGIGVGLGGLPEDCSDEDLAAAARFDLVARLQGQVLAHDLLERFAPAVYRLALALQDAGSLNGEGVERALALDPSWHDLLRERLRSRFEILGHY